LINSYASTPTAYELIADIFTGDEEIEIMGKFDVVIGNPPYKNGLHIKILSKVYDLLEQDGEILFIHPSTNFINIKKTKMAYSGVNKKIQNDIISLRLVNANILFSARFFIPCSITYIKKGFNKPEVLVTFTDGEECLFSELSKVNIWAAEDFIFPLLHKFQRGNTLHDKLLSLGSSSPLVVDLGQIRGSSSKTKITADDFYTFLARDYQLQKEKSNLRQNCFGFQTEQEAQNFINYLKTNFARRALSLYKINSQLSTGELKAVPWLDFSQEWSDEKLAKEFELTQEEIDFVNEIPQYY
jgi:hypothetical protein